MFIFMYTLFYSIFYYSIAIKCQKKNENFSNNDGYAVMLNFSKPEHPRG